MEGTPYSSNYGSGASPSDAVKFHTQDTSQIIIIIIQTDHLISARRPDLIIINKKKERKSAKLSTLLSRQTTE